MVQTLYSVMGIWNVISIGQFPPKPSLQDTHFTSSAHLRRFLEPTQGGSYAFARGPLNNELGVLSQQSASIPAPNPSHQIWHPIVYDPQFEGRPRTDPYDNYGNIPTHADASTHAKSTNRRSTVNLSYNWVI